MAHGDVRESLATLMRSVFMDLFLWSRSMVCGYFYGIPAWFAVESNASNPAKNKIKKKKIFKKVKSFLNYDWGIPGLPEPCVASAI